MKDGLTDQYSSGNTLLARASTVKERLVVEASPLLASRTSTYYVPSSSSDAKLRSIQATACSTSLRASNK